MTTTPILTTHPQYRRYLTIAVTFGAGAALGVAGTVLSTGDHTLRRAAAAEIAAEAKTGVRLRPIALDAKDHPGYGPIDLSTSAATWSGDAKDHPGYGPIDLSTSAATWSGDAKDHPGYGPIDLSTSAATWSGDAKDHPGYGPIDLSTSAATWSGDAKDHPGYGPIDRPE